MTQTISDLRPPTRHSTAAISKRPCSHSIRKSTGASLRSFPAAGTYHGREAVKRYLTQSRAAWAEASSEPERFITSGNRIVVFVHARVRAKDSNQCIALGGS